MTVCEMKACITLTLTIHGSLSQDFHCAMRNQGQPHKIQEQLRKLLYADVTYGLKITNFLKDCIQQNK